MSHGTHNYSLWPVDFPNPNGLISWWRKPLDSTTSEPRFTRGFSWIGTRIEQRGAVAFTGAGIAVLVILLITLFGHWF